MTEQPTENTQRTRFFLITKALVVVIFGIALSYFVYANTVNPEARFPFKLGLDLAGGSHLVYRADVSAVAEGEVDGAMASLRDVIERRINVFGVSEPIVQVERGSVVAGGEQRLIVELPGVTDINAAVDAIGKTPLLEFKLVDPNAVSADVLSGISALVASSSSGAVPIDVTATSDRYIDTGLTGRYLERATLQFGQTAGSGLSNEPIIVITFNEEGAQLFEQITTDHIGEQLAIFLDGVSLSEPVIREPIAGGTATISGNFTPEEARELVRNLNFGALPVPIELASSQTIGASLGDEALRAGVYAGVVGFILLSIFMILWYRLPGFVAVLALSLYVVMMLAILKLVPIVITAAGIAGFILSVGLAVDANILIAERLKEELAAGKKTDEAIREGFARAWLAIRDSNITHIIASVILFWFGTALIKGFALVFAIGVAVSMFSAITVSRTLLLAIGLDAEKPLGRFLLHSGFKF